MCFSSLHPIELQLLMQFCDARDLLRLARCSQTLLCAASCAFAWKSAPLIPFEFTNSDTDLPDNILQSPLLSFSNFSIEWVGRKGETVEESELAALVRIPRVKVLDARRWINAYEYGVHTIRETHWLQILTAPLMAGLRALYIGHRNGSCVLDSRCMQAIAEHLPHLATFHLMHDGRIVRGTYGSHLSSLPQLTDLFVTSNLQLEPESVEFAGRCTRLEKLGLNYCRSEVVHRVLTSAGLSRTLRELHLVAIRCGEGIEWDLVFQSLRQLKVLSLSNCFDAEVALRHASDAITVFNFTEEYEEEEVD